MPPPLLDDMQIANAMRNDALPALERLAGNSSLRDRALSRFDRDEPPPYVSSTEDEDENEFEIVPQLDPDISRFLDEPLDDRELNEAAWTLVTGTSAYHPGTRYNDEAEFERHRIEMWARRASNATREFFLQYGPERKGRAGRERINIIARRNIRRRWQKLGVWNPEWGIPDRKNDPQASDKTWDWKWPWQHGDAAAEWKRGDHWAMVRNPRHPITRALELRRGLRRSAHSPMLPRSHLKGDFSASQAESFIISRPWLMFKVEASEQMERRHRLSLEMSRRYNASKPPMPKDRWEERGDWKPEWRDRSSGDTLIGWKWRHESPSPEPEDLSALEDLATLDLTPSEVDALEAIPPPSPPTPEPVYDPSAHPGTGLFASGPLLPEPWGGGLFADPPPAVLEEEGSEVTPPPAAPVEAETISQEAPRPRTRQCPNKPPSPQQPLRRSARVLVEPDLMDHEPPRRRTRQHADKPSSPQQPLRRSARVAARNAALAVNQTPAPTRPHKPSRVAKPPAPSRGRPRKKKTAR